MATKFVVDGTGQAFFHLRLSIRLAVAPLGQRLQRKFDRLASKCTCIDDGERWLPQHSSPLLRQGPCNEWLCFNCTGRCHERRRSASSSVYSILRTSSTSIVRPSWQCPANGVASPHPAQAQVLGPARRALGLLSGSCSMAQRTEPSSHPLSADRPIVRSTAAPSMSLCFLVRSFTELPQRHLR